MIKLAFDGDGEGVFCGHKIGNNIGVVEFVVGAGFKGSDGCVLGAVDDKAGLGDAIITGGTLNSEENGVSRLESAEIGWRERVPTGGVGQDIEALGNDCD